MNAGDAIREAIGLIDQWVQKRPPAAHYQRVYEIPWDQDQSSENAVRIFWDDPNLAAFVKHFADRQEVIPELRPASEADVRAFDGSYFEGMRLELLDRPLRALQSLLTPTLASDLACLALTGLLYGNVHNVLWQLHVHRTASLSPQTLAQWGLGAEYALGQLLQLRGLSRHDWIDTIIRIQFVRAWALIMAGQHPQAAVCILLLAGWYAHAEKENLQQVTRARHHDYVTALYAMLDYESQGTPCEFTDSVALLLKGLPSDAYRVSPAWLLSWAVPEGTPTKISQPPFDVSRLVDAQERLGERGVLIDMVMTDNRLHLRALYLDERRHSRELLADTQRPVPPGESERSVKYITPSSVIFIPVYHEDLEQEQRVDSNLLVLTWPPEDEREQLAASVGPESEFVQWRAICREIRVYRENAQWAWQAELNSIVYPSNDAFWSTVYEAIYAKIMPQLEAKQIRHLVISPDGSLAPLPHHLLRDESNRRLGDRFDISYSPNLLGLTACLERDRCDRHTCAAVLVKDPTESLKFSAWECGDISSILGPRASVIEPPGADVDRIEQAVSEAGIFHFSGHARFDWQMPDASYLALAGDRKLGLPEIRSLRLARGALVFLSACGSARTGQAIERCLPHGIVNAFFEAGAATVIGTLWAAESDAAALVSHWFYRFWLLEQKGRLESLNAATKRLREATRADCEQILSSRVRRRGEKPFAEEYFWGAFVLYGAW